MTKNKLSQGKYFIDPNKYNLIRLITTTAGAARRNIFKEIFNKIF